MRIPLIVLLAAVLWALSTQLPVEAKHALRAHLGQAVDTATQLLYR